MSLKSLNILKLQLVRETSEIESEKASTPKACAEIARKFLGPGPDREHFLVLILSTSNEITGINLVSVGTLNGALVHPREVFKAAILGNANAVILAHNHPSGTTRPSAEDQAITRRLVEAGRILGIEVLDHVIVTNSEAYFSFRESGLLT